MITSKRINTLLESYSNIFKIGSKTVMLYENPSSSDFVEMRKVAKEDNRNLDQVRFIASYQNKKVYVWDAYLATHYSIREKLGLATDSIVPYIIDGEASVTASNVPKVYQLYKVDKTKPFGSWAWVDKYVSNCSKEFDRYKRLFSK
jgi:hypothetical protein